MSFIISDYPGFTLLHGDCMQVLSSMTEKFDMIFADPPYFLSNGGLSVKNGRVASVDKGEWDKGGTPEHIDAFNRQWLALCRERLTDNGTIWISGTYHNIYNVGLCLNELGYKILNVITWQKSDPPPMLSKRLFQFSAEYIIWAAKSKQSRHYMNYDLMKALTGGKPMTDVWRIPAVGLWEKRLGKHPTQKPLHLLYRIIVACTKPGDKVLDPFAGSCTTGIAANLLNRSFVGIDMTMSYLELGRRRYAEISNADTREKMFRKMIENPEELTVLINHARSDLYSQMLQTGICYMRAGDTRGSLLVAPGFERMQYLLLHNGGHNPKLFRLNKKARFNIWTRDTLEQYGFHPEHAPYYVVIFFDPEKEIEYKTLPPIVEGMYTYCPRLRRFSDFVGIR